MCELYNLTFACGPTTMVYTDLELNYSIATQLYACGKDEQNYSKRSSANHDIKLSFANIITIILAFMSTLIFAASDDTALDSVETVSLAGVDGIVFNVTNNVAVDDDFILDLVNANALAIIDNFNGKYYEVVSTNTTTDSLNGTNVNLAKRCTPTGDRITTVTEWQSAQSGTWWSPWYPVSCCYYCDKGPTSCSIEVGYAFSYGWSVTGGVTLAQIQVTTSYTLTRNYQRDSKFSCSWNGGKGPGQIWYQQQVYWADMQKRTRIFSPGCNVVLPWSQYYRSNVPIQDQYHVGCSVGDQNVQCSEGRNKCVYY